MDQLVRQATSDFCSVSCFISDQEGQPAEASLCKATPIKASLYEAAPCGASLCEATLIEACLYKAAPCGFLPLRPRPLQGLSLWTQGAL